MDTHQNIRLSEMSRKDQQDEESHGLLGKNEERDNESEGSSFGELPWEDATTPRESKKRRWFKILSFALVASWAVGLLIHILMEPQHHEQSTLPVITGRLRSEEDYVLDPKWDFDAEPTTREYHWNIAEHVLNPDGVYRPMMLINATFPGPLIECNEGDELIVHIHNNATNATSIHWHGLYQNGTNYMDGTVGITQCPIAPGGHFTYRFKVSGQTGTYWYHSHMTMQASDGLVGPIVIHGRGDDEKELQRVSYSHDRVVMVSDHYYDLSSSLLVQYLAPGSENDEPVPQAALINGRGTRNCSDLPSRTCDPADRSNAFFNLSSQHHTRLRFINVGAFAEFQIQIDETEFQLTEVDGVDVHPQSIHRLNINPGQRYSVIVAPRKTDNRLYWLRARMISHCFSHEEPELKEEVRAVISYGSPPEGAEPDSKDWPEVIELECRDLNTSALRPVKKIAAPAEPADQIYLRSSFQIKDWRLSRGYLNDSSYRADLSKPTLNYMNSDEYRHREDYMMEVSRPYFMNTKAFDPKTTLVYQTSGVRTIDILIQNLDDGNHPFHLHGYTFWVLASGHSYPPPNLYDNLDLTNPLRRDTASVEAFGWTLIRFVADNPGIWAFHCHIGWHSEAGLLMQFATLAVEVVEMKIPAEVKELCAAEGITKGAGPADDIWVGTFD